MKRLTRGDAIMAIRPRGTSKRAAGLTVSSPVYGYFVMRHKRPDGELAVVWRRADSGRTVGHDSSYDPASVVFVLRERRR